MKVRVTLMTSNDAPVSALGSIDSAERIVKSSWDMFVALLKMQSKTDDDIYVEKIEIVKDEE